jgi:sugar-specific transcriptional regulator TrmB
MIYINLFICYVFVTQKWLKNRKLYILANDSINQLNVRVKFMLVQKDFLNKLRDFGLNTYESKIWTALLSRGVSTAGELSDIADVPRSRSYDVLESLEKKGFILVKPGKPIKYIAVKPEEVIERVKNKVKEQTEQQLELIEKLKTEKVLDELNVLHTQGLDLIEPTDLTGAIRGRKNIYHHLATMIKNAKKSITIVTSTDGAIRKRDALSKHLIAANQKGVSIRIASPNNKELKELSKIAEIKQTNLKSRFCIVDSKEILFMLMDDEKVHPSYDIAIWANTEFFASVLDKSFNSFLKK